MFFDDYTRISFVYFLKSKSTVDRCVCNFVEFVEWQTGEKVTHLCSDNGGEYDSQSLTVYLEQMEIVFEKQSPILHITIVLPKGQTKF